MNNEIKDLDTAGLRRFALTTAGMVASMFGVVLPLLFRKNWPFWPWVMALVLMLWGQLLPATLRLPYRGWMRLALLLGWLNSMLLLSSMFICVISPAGILMRLFGYDPLRLRYAAHLASYRKASVSPLRKHMEKPY